MTRDMILTELQNRGYRVEHAECIKNGVVFEGIRFLNDSDIAPMVYTDFITNKANENNISIEEVVSEIIAIYEANSSIDFDVDEFFNRDFVLSHVYIGMQKESTEELIKRSSDFEGIESYLLIRKDQDNGDSFTVKLNEAILNRVQITEAEAWDNAERNTNAETVIRSMVEVIAELFDMDLDGLDEDNNSLYIISNKSKVKGASAILNKEVLAQFGSKYKTNKIAVLPSSIHEMIILPYTDDMNLDELSAMVSEVNNTEVRPEERLTDRAYIVTI